MSTSSLIAFDDAVTAANLPNVGPTQSHGVFYLDGAYANEEQVRARLPHAILAGITVFGMTSQRANFCDCEKGDLTPAQAEAWVAKQVELDVKLLGVYASLDTWHNGLWAALEKYGNRIKRWCAAYDQLPSLTLTYEGSTYTFDAHQWASDTRVDRNVARPSFFTAWTPPTKPAKKPVVKPSAKPRPAKKAPADYEAVKDRLYIRRAIRLLRKALPTRFGGFRP